MEHQTIREDLVICPDIEGYSFVENGKCETCGENLTGTSPNALDVLLASA